MTPKSIRVGDEIIEIPAIRKSWFYWGILGILGLWLIFSAFYTVDADEVGVIQRFGRYTRTTNPGLHFKMPFGVETVKRSKSNVYLKKNSASEPFRQVFAQNILAGIFPVNR